MSESAGEILDWRYRPTLNEAILLLAFDGWMDGGEVSTGTVRRLVDLLQAKPFATIDPEPFYIYNVPGPMDVAALFRPEIEIEDGLVTRVEMPSNTFYEHQEANLALFLGKEPNLRWRTFGDVIIALAQQTGIRRILFVGSFGGDVPHTRQPRLYVTCSEERLLDEMKPFGVRRSGYEGPGSFTSYLLHRAPEVGLEMISLVAEIPGYLQGANPVCIEAVTRRLAKILKLPLDLAPLRAASTRWELKVTSAVERDEELAAKVRAMEEAYDNELLEQEGAE